MIGGGFITTGPVGGRSVVGARGPRAGGSVTNFPLHVVILAGGIGKRFRPYSSDQMPKQFLSITHRDRSMLQVTLDRFEGVVPPERIWVATNHDYVDIVQRQVPGILRQNIIGEPMMKNTAPAIATVVHRIAARDEWAVAAVMPADHFVGDAAVLSGQLKEAAEYAFDSGKLLTFGIPPTWPSPDYGYIEVGAASHDNKAGVPYREGVLREARGADRPGVPREGELLLEQRHVRLGREGVLEAPRKTSAPDARGPRRHIRFVFRSTRC